MKIDPNQTIESHPEYVLCEKGCVVLASEQTTQHAALAQPGSAFTTFCESLDPNRCFIIALIPDDADRDVFFTAREIAQDIGVHMQAIVEKPEIQRRRWAAYLQAKQMD